MWVYSFHKWDQVVCPFSVSRLNSSHLSQQWSSFSRSVHHWLKRTIMFCDGSPLSDQWKYDQAVKGLSLASWGSWFVSWKGGYLYLFVFRIKNFFSSCFNLFLSLSSNVSSLPWSETFFILLHLLLLIMHSFKSRLNSFHTAVNKNTTPIQNFYIMPESSLREHKKSFFS